MKIYLFISLIFIAGCHSKTKELYENINSVRIGDSHLEIENKMGYAPDAIKLNDSLRQWGKMEYGLNSYIYFTGSGASSDIYIYVRSDTVYYIWYD